MKKFLGFAFLTLVTLALNSCKNSVINSPVAGPAFTLVAPLSFWAFGSNGTGNGQFTNPFGVTVDTNNGNIYVADWNNNNVQKFTSNGTFLVQWGSSQLSNPEGLAVWGGVVYVADSAHNQIEEYDLSGNNIGHFGGGDGGFDGPAAVALDTFGNIYVVDQWHNQIQKFNPSGGFLLAWGSSISNPGSGDGQFNHPQWIDVDSNNNVYVVDLGNNRVEKFDVNGNYILQWGAMGNSQGQFNGISGMAVDGKGHVYVADNGNHRIEKFDGTGKYIMQWGGGGSSLGKYGVPINGLACDADGNVYVADAGNSRVEVTNNPYNYAGLNTLGIFPNPVTPGQDADIAFQLNSTLGFSITIKDTSGNVVNQYQGQGVQGDNILQWNMTSGGNLVDPGTYFVTFQSGSIQATQTLTYVR